MPSASEVELKTIEAMLSVASSRDTPLAPSWNQGYTYLGQFIAHELAPPTADSLHVLKRRSFTGGLSLTSVYGTKHKYLPEVNADGTFRLDSKDYEGKCVADLRRGKRNAVLIPEPRNDENTIISQLHLLWLRFHNALITSGMANTFDEAKKGVVLIFQWLVIEDFLHQLLASKVFEYFFRSDGQNVVDLDYGVDDGLPVPLEFSLAAFRFGHSMVRNSYTLHNENAMRPEPIPLAELFRRDKKLTPKFEIDWELFFDSPQSDSSPPAIRADSATSADQIVSRSMLDVHQSQRAKDGRSEFRPGANIVLRNVMANRKLRDPTALTFISKRISEGAQKTFGIDSMVLKGLESGLKYVPLNDLGLWSFVLLEARQHAIVAVATSESSDAAGLLGPVGSLVVGQTLRNAIARTEGSLIHETSDSECRYSELKAQRIISRILEYLGGDYVRDGVATRTEVGNAEKPFVMRSLIDFVVQAEANQ